MRAENRAQQSPSVVVSIAAHHVPKRVPFLAEVLRAIADWDETSVMVTLDTNDLALADEPLIKECAQKLEATGFTLECDQAHGMAHPFHLTWWHKPRLRSWADKPDRHPEDLFIYIEDDIVITRENLKYFRRRLPSAKANGVIPGFLRFEKSGGKLMSPDYRGYQAVQGKQRMVLDGQNFIAPEFSYWAGFVMDPELCAEYLKSPWSDLDNADTMPQSAGHTCRVQSAWALTFVNVPNGLPSRYVVPVDEADRPLEDCFVWHSANNYTQTKALNFGTVPMRSIFQPMGLGVKIKQLIWDMGALRRRVISKIQRTLARG